LLFYLVAWLNSHVNFCSPLWYILCWEGHLFYLYISFLPVQKKKLYIYIYIYIY
jgi:hypothetical protein